MTKKFYGPFGRLVKWAYGKLHRSWKVQYEATPEGAPGLAVPDGQTPPDGPKPGVAPPPEPVVYVVHHQNMFGPLHMMGLAPFEAQIWALHVFLDRRECFEQYYRYTFTQRYGWPKPAAFVVVGIISLVVPALMRSLRAIPVYRDGEAIGTFRASVAALKEGRSVVICPDEQYADPSAAMGEMYAGFLGLAKLYYKKTGLSLSFVPVCCSAKQEALVFGGAVRFDAQRDFAAEQQRMAEALRDGINQMALRCGDITEEEYATAKKLPAAGRPGKEHAAQV